MATPQRTSMSVSCPGCGGTFVVSSDLAGRRGRCKRCGTVLNIPARPPEPQLIGVLCRVCGTPLYGQLADVGKTLKCPDCYARTELPPPKPQRKNIPAALEGEQYELWGVDEAPLPSELAAASGPQIPVHCWLCETLMHATEEQIGQDLVCPDCGSRTPVVAPKVSRPGLGNRVPAGEEYEVDWQVPPSATPQVISPEAERHIRIRDDARLDGSGQESERARRSRRRLDARGRPILPRWPLISGVVPFLLSPGVPARWTVLSMGLLVVGGLLLWSLQALGVLAPAATGGISADAATAIAGVAFLAGGTVLGIIWLAAGAVHALAIVTESSEGNDQVEAWPAINVADWLPESFCLTLTVAVSAVPGWLIGQFVARNSAESAVWLGGGMLLCFPVVLLSQLAASSPAAVLSGTVLVSLLRCPFSWLMYFLESALLAAGCCAIVWFAANVNPAVVLLLAPVYVMAAILYFRLLGRLGWRLSATMSASSEAESDDRKN